MKQNQKPCTKLKKVINRGKRSKTLSEVKPVENINKNLQSFLEISPVNIIPGLGTVIVLKKKIIFASKR